MTVTLSQPNPTIATADKATLRKFQAVLKKLQDSGVDAFLVTDLSNIRWLTGFTGSNATVLLTTEALWLFTDSRYREQVKNEIRIGQDIITQEGFLHEWQQDSFSKGTCKLWKRIGFQADKLPYAEAERLHTTFSEYQWSGQSGFFDAFVATKTEDELASITKAVSITDRVFEKILTLMSPNVTERDIAAEISYWNKKFGGERDAFDPIVAGGPRGAQPHARASASRLPENGLVVIDMGTVVNGFCSDQTRTVAIGTISTEERNAYAAVLEAHLLGIRSLKPGMTGEAIDGIVRNFLDERGYGTYFSHSLGHSVGIDVHEKPILGRRRTMPIPVGSTVTIEPGVYFPNRFGIRIEDIVYVTENGATPLPKAPKELIEL